MRIVLDASAVLALLLGHSPAAEKIATYVRDHGGNVHAPHLLDVEVAEVLRRQAARHPEQAERCHRALEDLRTMPIHRYPQDFLFDRTWELRGQLTTSEATYVALAEYLEATLVTFDSALQCEGHAGEIMVL